MITHRLHRLFTYSLTILSFISLNGCPIPTTNKLMLASSSENKSLPFSIRADKALVYLVQPYVDIDLFLVGGAASDGWGSQQSKIYIRSKISSFQYLGALDRYQPLCFYANPGQYELKILNSKSAKPELIYETIHLLKNKYYFYGIEEKTYVATTQFTFKVLTPEEAVHYIHAGGRFNKGISSCKDI